MMSDSGPHIQAGGSKGGLEHTGGRSIFKVYTGVYMSRYGLFYWMIT